MSYSPDALASLKFRIRITNEKVNILPVKELWGVGDQFVNVKSIESLESSEPDCCFLTLWVDRFDLLIPNIKVILASLGV